MLTGGNEELGIPRLSLSNEFLIKCKCCPYFLDEETAVVYLHNMSVYLKNTDF